MKIHSFFSINSAALAISLIVSLSPDPCQKKEGKRYSCEEAKRGSDNATILSRNITFDSAKAEILQAFTKDHKEHAFSFGKDTTGNIFRSGINTGSNYSGTIPAINNRFADIHNHPGNSPPFSDDIYGLIDLSKSNPDYLRFVVTTTGTIYALIVTNINAAREFNTNYPRQAPVSGFELRFPDKIVDEIREAEFQAKGRKEIALALILEKYNTGIALLMRNNKGNFNRINAKESNGQFGEKTYVASYCE